MSDGWKQDLANEAEKALEHDLVTEVREEFEKNVAVLGWDVANGLPAYGLAKVMHYVATVARAQALGIDPDLLRLSRSETNAALMDKAEAMARAGVPTLIVGLGPEAKA